MGIIGGLEALRARGFKGSMPVSECLDAKPNPAADQRPALLRALAGERTTRPPVWFMRQAGRSLPEYRAVRATTSDFISFCFDPEKAAEVTLQPLRRFPMDAAIVFADILLIPLALGQKVWFEAGEGPKLGPLPEVKTLRAGLDRAQAVLAPVSETLRRVRASPEFANPSQRALIGFAGAPWTVLTYMIEGGSSDRAAARDFAYREPGLTADLLDVLVDATIGYLHAQANAGAQALQLFESWAEGLSEPLFETLVIKPHRRIVEGLRAAGVTTPIIGFPRGSGALVERYAEVVPVQGVALDTQASLDLGLRIQASGKTIQGALDPLLLRAGGQALDRRIDQLIEAWSAGPYIFNLGHGVLPDTPIVHIEQAVRQVSGR